MKTFLQMRRGFLETLAQLKRLEGPEKITSALRMVKEEEIGKLCYQAEEDLPADDLSLLKDILGVEKSRWEIYKSAVIVQLPHQVQADRRTPDENWLYQSIRDKQTTAL